MPHAPDLSGCALDGRYELLALLGEGAFGRVYRGRDRRLDRRVAVKVIKPWWAEDPEWAQMFERETQLLARLDDPGIVRIYDVGHAAEGLYYVSELVEGEDLAARLRRGPLTPVRACEIAHGVARALSRAHAERIVHRDVKPANILLAADGRVKVGDFGVARLAEGSSDGAGASIVGTPRYMAPEQANGGPLSPATDVYSVGVVLYELLTGRPPFAAEAMIELALAHLSQSPPPLPETVPAELAAVVARALAKQPAERFADGAALAEALEPALEHAREWVAPGRQARRSGRPASLTRGRAAAPPSRRMAYVSAPGAALPSRPSGAAVAPGRLRGPDHAPGGPGNPGGPGGPGSQDGHGGHGGAGATQAAPRFSPRRTVDPPGRRRAMAALGLVLALVGAMVAAALLLTPGSRARVPLVSGQRLGPATRALRRAHLTARVARAYSSRPAGTVVSQQPAAGTLRADGSRVSLVISRGQAPVTTPAVTGDTVADAQRTLRSLGLRTNVHLVAAPQQSPGTVTRQFPAATRPVPRGTTISLSVAEVPSWHTTLTFSTRASGPVTIRGSRWRLVYRMAFQGTCTWIVFCSGPSARVTNLATGAVVARFGLQDGGEQTQTVASGPGRYAVQVTPGDDTATWSVAAQDLY